MLLFGPPNVEMMKSKRDVKGLIKALSFQKDTNIRKAAIEVLQQMLNEPVIVALETTALKDTDEGVRKTAVESLGFALRDTKKEIAKAASESLLKIGSPAVETLVIALADPINDVRCQAAAALGKIGDVRAVEPLIEALKDPNADVRAWASYAFTKISDPRAIEPLVTALKDPDWRMRNNAAFALGKIGDTRAVEPLIEALKDSNDKVVGQVAAALGKIGDARSVEPLIEELNDPDADVRSSVAGALGKIGDARSDEPLKKFQAENKKRADWLKNQPRCSRCGLTSDKFFEKLQAAHRSKYPLGGPSLVQVTNLVGVCPKCRKAFCNNHCIAANPHEYFDEPKCPEDGTHLDFNWDDPPSEDKPWRIGARPK